MASCAYRSVRLASFRSMYSPGSKSFTSPAKRTGRAAGSNCAMVSTPLRPSNRADQQLCTSLPTAERRPVPVMTTRRFISPSPRESRSSLLRLDVVDGVPDRLHLLGILVRDFDPELLFERHDELDGV